MNPKENKHGTLTEDVSPTGATDYLMNEWISYRSEQIAPLDIRQAVMRDIQGSPLSSPQTVTDEQENVLSGYFRIIFSELIRAGLVVGWFVFGS